MMAKRRRPGKSEGGSGQGTRGGGRVGRFLNGHHSNGHNGHALPRLTVPVMRSIDQRPADAPGCGSSRQRPCEQCGALVFGRYPRGCPGAGPAGRSKLCVYGAWAFYKGKPPADVLKRMGLEPRPPADPPAAPAPSKAPPPPPERTVPVSVSFLPSLVKSIDGALERQETRSAFLQEASRRELARREEGGESHGA